MGHSSELEMNGGACLKGREGGNNRKKIIVVVEVTVT